MHGGRGGGVLEVAGPHGRFQIARRWSPSADGEAEEQLTLTAADGARQGDHFIKVLLSNVDEAVFNNVFAVGLREFPKSWPRSATPRPRSCSTASQLAWTACPWSRCLGNSKARATECLTPPADRVRCCNCWPSTKNSGAEIEELAAANHRYQQLAAERDQLHGEITRLEEVGNEADRRSRLIEIALAVRDRWLHCAALDEELLALGPPRLVPKGAIERLDALNARVQKHRQKMETLGRLRRSLRREFQELRVNESLRRQTARIEALQEQQPWMARLQNRMGNWKPKSAA